MLAGAVVVYVIACAVRYYFNIETSDFIDKSSRICYTVSDGFGSLRQSTLSVNRVRIYLDRFRNDFR